MDLSANIKAIREAKRVKQLEIATALDIDPSNYAKLEKRGNKLTLEQLEKIAGALGVSVMELITGEAQTVQNDERVKELELLVNHWKELAETRNERLQIMQRHLKGYKEILLDELSEIIFLWIQDNGDRYGLDPLDKWLLPLEESILKIQPEQRKQIYRESIIYRNKLLDYAISEGLLGEVGKAFKAAQTEFMNQLLQIYNKSEEKLSAKPKE